MLGESPQVVPVKAVHAVQLLAQELMRLHIARCGTELEWGLNVCHQRAAGIVAVGLDYVTCAECAVH